MGWVPEGGLAVMMERQQQILPGSEEGGGGISGAEKSSLMHLPSQSLLFKAQLSMCEM